MKTILTGAFMLMTLFCANFLVAQCGITGPGTDPTAGNAPCGTVVRYQVPNNCGCNTGWEFDFTIGPGTLGVGTIVVTNTTSVPFTFSNPTSGISGTVVASGHIAGGATYVDVIWDCKPCPTNGTHFNVHVDVTCANADESIDISCIPPGGGGPGGDSCRVDVSEFTCLKFHASATPYNCCTCVRIEFEDGTVLYDIISAGINNDATLCYEKPIKSYTLTSIACQNWCGSEPTEKTSGQPHGSTEPTSSGLKLYPNPATSSQVSAKYNSLATQTLRYEIADMNGRVLMSGELDANSGENNWEINCESCKSKQPYNFILLDQNYKVLESKMLLLNF